MSATYSINLETCYDYAFSEVINVLLKAGVIWKTTVDGQKLYDYGESSEVALDCLMSDQDSSVILSELDTQFLAGQSVAIFMSINDRYYFSIIKHSKREFTILIDAGRPLLTSTWMTDSSAIMKEIITPLFTAGICLLEITTSDSNT